METQSPARRRIAENDRMCWGLPPVDAVVPATARTPLPPWGLEAVACHSGLGHIEIVLRGDADQGKQGVMARISQRRSPNSVRGGRIRQPAHRPIRGDLFVGGMGENRSPG
jgi:hypothetical protein